MLWHTFGLTHIPRPEDWPIMPVDYAGFWFKPYGFLDVNPAMDVPVAVAGALRSTAMALRRRAETTAAADTDGTEIGRGERDDIGRPRSARRQGADVRHWAPGADAGETHAIAVRGALIAATGADAEALIGPDTRVVELEGRTVIPGINDAHLHLVCYAMARFGLRDVSGDTIGRWEDLSGVLTADAVGDDGWIRAQGWDAASLGRPGTVEDVDAALRVHGLEETPTVLFDRTGHQLLVGSAALRRLGIDRTTADPQGGVVARDDAGEPTGVFTDAATALVLRGMPQVPASTLTGVLRAAQRELAALGITSVTDPGIGPGHATLFDGSASPLALTALADLARRNELTVRTSVLLTFSGTGGESAMTVRDGLSGGLRHAFDDPAIDAHLLRVAGVKVFADGIQRSGTAWHREPYGPHASRGQLAVAGDTEFARMQTLADILRIVAEADLQTGVHATGDAASDAVVAGLVSLAPALRERLPYLIHGDFLPAGGMAELAAANIGWTANPVISRMVCGIGLALLGPDRQAARQPLESALRAGVTVTLSSDAPVVSPDWREAVVTAVERAQIDGTPHEGDPESVSVVDAVAMLTVMPARLDGAAAYKGRLTPGYVADIAVLSGPLPDDERVRQMLNLDVDLTLMGGRIVYER